MIMRAIFPHNIGVSAGRYNQTPPQVTEANPKTFEKEETMSYEETNTPCSNNCPDCSCDHKEVETTDEVLLTVVRQESSGLITATFETEDKTKDGHFYLFIKPDNDQIVGEVIFQHGTVKEVGINGSTNESVLAALIHRTKHLDSLYPCDENKEAIEHLEKALAAFDKRTTNRVARGVEGQYKV